MMGPMNPIVFFIKFNFMKTTITVNLTNGDELTGEVVSAFDSLVGLDVGNAVTYINANQIVTFTKI